jgi:hypothetical protein
MMPATISGPIFSHTFVGQPQIIWVDWVDSKDAFEASRQTASAWMPGA